MHRLTLQPPRQPTKWEHSMRSAGRNACRSWSRRRKELSSDLSMKELLLTINRYSFKFQKIHIYLKKKKIQSCRCILHLYQIHSNILIPNWKAGNVRGVCAFFLFFKNTFGCKFLSFFICNRCKLPFSISLKSCKNLEPIPVLFKWWHFL